jgi:hypothetical protein
MHMHMHIAIHMHMHMHIAIHMRTTGGRPTCTPGLLFKASSEQLLGTHTPAAGRVTLARTAYPRHMWAPGRALQVSKPE